MFSVIGDNHKLSQNEAGRKLVAIMFTDLMGYTSLSQRNEKLALELLEEHRDFLRPLFSKHGGVEIKTMGDAFLVEFPSALGAVKSALDIQQSLHELNSHRVNEKRIILRIGIHLGDVIHLGDDVYGDAVNLASRIEPLAEPGGICISEQVYDHIVNKFDFPLSSIGKRELKNVELPVEIYKVDLIWKSEDQNAGTESDRFVLDKHRLAVLPLVNMISDRGDEYFTDGMTEELISTVSRISGLHVISRTSVAQYKNSLKKIVEIGKDLRVGSVVEGSVRKSNDRVRVAVQLIDVKTDEHIWSEHYDRQLEDVFGIQSDIAQRVAESLRVRLLTGEKKQVERIATSDTEAHNLYFKGRYFWRQRTVDGLSKAIDFFKQAVERDPNYALGFSGLADCYTASAVYGLPYHRELRVKQRQSALKSVELDETLSEGHCSLGIGFGLINDFKESQKEFEKAIELNSNYSTAHHFFAQVLATMGRHAEALSEAEKARDIDPLSPTTTFTIAFVRILAGEPEKAISELENYRELDTNYLPINLWLGLLYAEGGKFQEGIGLIKSATATSSDCGARPSLCICKSWNEERIA